MFAHLASINWLFNEGFYLHSKLTVNIFNTSDAPFKLFHALGWGKLQMTSYIFTNPTLFEKLVTTILVDFHNNMNLNDK